MLEAEKHLPHSVKVYENYLSFIRILCSDAAFPNPRPRDSPLCIFCMSLLVNTPDSDNQPIRKELCAWTVFPIDMIAIPCSLLPTPWAGEIRLSFLHFGMDLRCTAACLHTQTSGHHRGLGTSRTGIGKRCSDALYIIRNSLILCSLWCIQVPAFDLYLASVTYISNAC